MFKELLISTIIAFAALADTGDCECVNGVVSACNEVHPAIHPLSGYACVDLFTPIDPYIPICTYYSQDYVDCLDEIRDEYIECLSEAYNDWLSEELCEDWDSVNCEWTPSVEGAATRACNEAEVLVYVCDNNYYAAINQCFELHCGIASPATSLINAAIDLTLYVDNLGTRIRSLMNDVHNISNEEIMSEVEDRFINDEITLDEYKYLISIYK